MNDGFKLKDRKITRPQEQQEAIETDLRELPLTWNDIVAKIKM